MSFFPYRNADEELPKLLKGVDMDRIRSVQKRTPESQQVSTPVADHRLLPPSSESPGMAYQRVKSASLDTVRRDDVMLLQRSIGNQAVAQLFQNKIAANTALQPQQQSKEETIQTQPVQSANHTPTGMPDNLKSGIERLSGLDMSDVRVFRDSDKPSQVGALAYTQGTDIHVGPGQGRHLPHEAWHAVQQKRGRVQPTTTAAGLPVNDDAVLEREADEMGRTALQMNADTASTRARKRGPVVKDVTPIQRMEMSAGSVPEDALLDGENKPASKTRSDTDDGRTTRCTGGHSKGPLGAPIQCTIGDGHDLTHPRFKGQIELEAAYDNERHIRMGRRGQGVTIVQQTLVDLGYDLPKYGVDGIFGRETRAAVIRFQTDQKATNLSFLVDGIVGEQTLTAMQNLLGGAPGPGPKAPPPAALNVIVPSHIRAADTHAAASDRIPPRKNIQIPIIITGLTPAMGTVKVYVKNGSAANGAVTVNGAASVNLAATSTVNLKGTSQTTPGNARNLKLVAEHGGKVIDNSAGFSVAAIPIDFSTTFHGIVKTATSRIMQVDNHHQSDSGVLGDLNRAKRSEQVQYGKGTGVFVGVTGNNSGYLAADVSPRTDSHGTPIAFFKSPGGTIVAEQVFIYKCARTGDNDIPVSNSGFRLTRRVFENPPASGTWDLRMSKVGTATTANGFASAAGAGSVTKILTV